MIVQPLLEMQYESERAYLLAHFQEYRIIQPTVIFLHGLPSALSQKNTLRDELQRIGSASRINLQSAGKDFFTAFVEFDREIPAALAILCLDGKKVMNRALRVFYGSTKFCPHYLKGHTCRLENCNYAHYFHPALTHLKDQAKDIDQHSIAFMFLSQDSLGTQLALGEMARSTSIRRPILPIDLGNVNQLFGISEPMAAGPIEEEGEKEGKEVKVKVKEERQGSGMQLVVQEEWCLISRQIDAEIVKTGELQQKGRRTRIQQFLQGAQRFLTKLIFQSSEFII